ncbi:MAG: DUF1559 domain-containing protein [Lentisphaerae bacterium]|nr:DUF1559 domain-containing protein [Lentisphaerota bacterium]
MTKRNYTLIELLTVIFIIAVLAGLIMPATSLVRGKARRTSCASNLKQVGALAMQFSNDRDGQIPLYKVDSSKVYSLRDKTIENAYRNKLRFSNQDNAKTNLTASNGKALMWTAGLVRYAKYNMNVFFCPSDERDLNIFEEGKNSSYSLNYGNDDRPGGTSGGTAFVKMSAVTRSPAGVILFGETDAGLLGMDSTKSASSFFSTYFKTPLARKPHSNEFNTSYLDGHVDFVHTSDLQAAFDKDAYKIK